MCSAADMPNTGGAVTEAATLQPPSSTIPPAKQDAPPVAAADSVEAALQSLELAVRALNTPTASNTSTHLAALNSAATAAAACVAAAATGATQASSTPSASATNNDINPTAALTIHQHERVLTVMRSVAAAIQHPHANLFIKPEGADQDECWVLGSPQTAVHQLDTAGKSALDSVRLALHVLTLLAQLSMPGVRVPFISTSTSLGSQVTHPPAAHSTASTHGDVSPALPPLLPSPTTTTRTLYPHHTSRPVIIEVLDVPDTSATDTSTATTDTNRQDDSHAVQARVQESREALVVELVKVVVTWWPGPPNQPCPWAIPLLPPSSLSSHNAAGATRVRAEGDHTVTLSEEGQLQHTPAGLLLTALVTAVGIRSHRSSSSSGAGGGDGGDSQEGQRGRPDEEQLWQRLLVHAGRTLLPGFRQVVLGGTAAWTQQQGLQAPFSAHTPTSTQDRVVAGRRVGCLISQLRDSRALASLLPVALPAALTTAGDGSAAVAVHGMAALRHMAEGEVGEELRVQGDLVLATGRKLIVGCQDCVWAHACATATALTCAVLGRKAQRAPGYHSLLCDMVSEMERHGSKQGRRAGFLTDQALPRLIQAQGLTVLRHMNRLLPLLLEWLQSYDAASRLAATTCLHTLLAHTWPRVAAHCDVVWQHVATVFVREAVACEATSAQLRQLPPGQQHTSAGPAIGTLPVCQAASSVAAEAVRVAELLAACGGPVFVQVLADTQQQLDAHSGGPGDSPAGLTVPVHSVAEFVLHNSIARRALQLLLAHAQDCAHKHQQQQP